LENVSKQVFREYYKLITDLVGDSPGIYALYDETELYYVGRSTELRKRVKHHLRDRHYASWTHFSLYMVRRVGHIGEIESLLVRIANPKGNRVVPKGKSGGQMLKRLKSMVKQEQKRKFDKMFGGKGKGKGKGKRKRKTTKKSSGRGPRSLKGLVQHQRKLFRTYKGKEYKATLTPSGIIKFGNKKYSSPSAAAKAIIDRKTDTVNGWVFWYIKNRDGEWVRLSDYQP
jgi:hypothetical protein